MGEVGHGGGKSEWRNQNDERIPNERMKLQKGDSHLATALVGSKDVRGGSEPVSVLSSCYRNPAHQTKKPPQSCDCEGL